MYRIKSYYHDQKLQVMMLTSDRILLVWALIIFIRVFKCYDMGENKKETEN